LIPIQDDRENVRRRGALRPDANTHAERRCAHPGTDPRVPQRQSIDRIHGPEPSRTIRICATRIGRSGVRRAGQETAGSNPGLLEQGHRSEPAANSAVDPPIPPRGSGRGRGVSPATLPDQIHQPGRDVVGGSGSRPQLAQRAGYGAHFQAGVRAVRQGRPCTPGGNLGGASVQSAAQPALPEAGGEVGADAAQRDCDRRATQARSARASGVSTHRHGTPGRLGRCQGGCITSMPWTQ